MPKAPAPRATVASRWLRDGCVRRRQVRTARNAIGPTTNASSTGSAIVSIKIASTTAAIPQATNDRFAKGVMGMGISRQAGCVRDRRTERPGCANDSGRRGFLPRVFPAPYFVDTVGGVADERNGNRLASRHPRANGEGRGKGPRAVDSHDAGAG